MPTLDAKRSRLHDTRTRVLVIGLGAAGLILWLSASFWLDAWHQSADARRFQRLSMLEGRLLELGDAFATERTLTLGAADVVAGGAFVLDESPTLEQVLADLKTLRDDNDARLKVLLASLQESLATPTLVDHMRDVPEAMHRMLAQFKDRHEALVRDRERFDQQLSGTTARAKGLSRVRLAALRVHQSSGQLVHHTQAVLNGVQLEPYKIMPLVESLRRVRADLQAFIEIESARLSLQGLVWTLTSAAGGTSSQQPLLESALDEANVRSRDAARQLVLVADERRVEESLRTALHTLLAEHRELLLAWGPVTPSITRIPRQHAIDLDERIAATIDGELAASKHSGYRRLVVDTALIAICFWIVFASLRLLDSIRHQATHDRLTALPNRSYFESRLKRALAANDADAEGGIALLMIDIDNFKSINDTFGHDIGDELLRQLATRLSERLGEHEFLAALGADEFAVALWASGSEARALQIAERLRSVCDESFCIGGAEMRITLSIGVGTACERTPSAQDLIRRTGIALRQAKDVGKDRAHAFSLELAEQSRARRELESELRRAIELDQLELHYQPKIDTRTGRVHGAEALVRWRHPERGLVPPGRFIPLAEQCGLILPIGAWVLEEAVRQAAQWHRDGLTEIQVAVNVSAEQLVGAGFAESVEMALDTHGLPPHLLELELTETVGMMDMALVVACLERLRASKVSIAIDDFGTDYSSLQYLEDLPLDTLKIDRAFVVKLDRPEQERTLVRTIVLMANSLGLRTVAEGVETGPQLDRVIALGCDLVQGYYYSKPVGASELPEVITRIAATSTLAPHSHAA